MHKNRISTSPPLVTGQAINLSQPAQAPSADPAHLPQDVQAFLLKKEIAAAREGDVVQIIITTQRQASTQDSFRIVQSGEPEETEHGWAGLARFFKSTGIADTVCYLTYVRQQLHPDDSDKWFCIVRGVAVYRCRPGGGKAETLKTDDLLPPVPGHVKELPDSRKVIITPGRPTNVFEAVLEQLVK